MSLGWAEDFRLGDACKIKHGYAFKGRYMTTREDPSLPIVVNIVNFQYTGGFRFESSKIQRYEGNYPKEYTLKIGNIILVMTCQTPNGEILGVPGIITDTNNTYLHNQRMGLVSITDPDKLDLSFLYYLFLSPNFKRYLFATATGAKILHTAPARIVNYRFSCPSLEIQKKIGAILSSFDKYIDSNTKTIKILEMICKRVYNEWILKFRGSFDYGKLIESNLGQIPENWNVIKLKDIVEFKKGIEPGSEKYLHEYQEGTVRFLRVGDLSDRGTKIFVKKTLSRDKILEKADIAITLDGTIGIVKRGLSGCYSSGIRKTIIKDENLMKYSFLYFLLKSDLIQSTIKAHTKGTTILHAGSAIDYMDFAIPPPHIMDRFDEVVSPLLEQKLVLSEKNAILLKVRDLLIPRLISGEVDVDGQSTKVGCV